MTQVTTVSGRVHNFDGYDWTVQESGMLVVKVGAEKYKTVFPCGQWESIKELGK